MSDRPMPATTAIDLPFWDGCDARRLLLQRCANPACARHIYYPRVCCPYCHGGTLDWVRVSGRGTIESYSKIHRPQHPSFQAEAPIYFVAVRLLEGPLMYSRLQHKPASDHGLLGHAVEVVFSEPDHGRRLPWFALRGEPPERGR